MRRQGPTLIDRHRAHDLVRPRSAFVRGDGLDPDAATVFEDAQVWLAAFALTIDDGQQSPPRFEERATQIHFPETPIDVAREALAEVGIGIGLVALPHLLQQGVKLALEGRLGAFRFWKPRSRLAPSTSKRSLIVGPTSCAAQHPRDLDPVIAVRVDLLAELLGVVDAESTAAFKGLAKVA